MPRVFTLTVTLTVTLTLFLPLAAKADNWPQWRGPKNDGHSAEKNLPAAWGPDQNVRWKAPMPGPGASTPCVWGDKIFLTAQAGKDLVLFCVGTDGKEKWKRTVGTGEGKFRGDEGNMASASCSTDGKRVYAFVGSGEVGAYDLATGKPVWEFDLQEKYGKFRIQFGAHWTPVLYKDRLYLEVIHQNAQFLLALDAATGAQVWKVDRASDSPPGVESPDNYCSPFVWEGATGALLIAHGDDYCTAHKLADGSEVWRVAGLNPKDNYNRAWRAVASPLVMPDLIVVPSCKNGVTVAIDPTKVNGEIAPGAAGELWRLPKGTPDVPSPVRAGDVVYIMRENGVLNGYDRKTGKPLFEEKLTNERHRANPVVADGKVYFVGREGNMAVVKAGPEFELLAKNKLPDTFTASPAIADGVLYLRGWNFLWAIKAK
ncbi:MAG: PQQ-binding-like beta-propeller repeat protein [Fimbriiglobus sp.]